MSKKSAAKPVEWLSDKAEWQQSNDPDFRYKIADFYTKFKFKNITAEIGDYILISNADSAEPDTVEGCDVAQITKLYESHDTDLQDRFRAHVQWFCKPPDVPVNCLKDSDIVLNENSEVVEDHRPFDKDVSIETFFKRCQILKLPTTSAVSEIVKNQTSKTTFICRFQLVIITRKKYILQPILEEERLEFSKMQPSLLKTPKSKCRENLTSSKTPNSLIKKFAASSLNDSRSWTIKNSETCKLILMRDITNKYQMTHNEIESSGKRKLSSKCNDVSPTKILNNKINGKKFTDADISYVLESGSESDSSNKQTLSSRRVLNFEKKVASSCLSKAPNTPLKQPNSKVTKSYVKNTEDSMEYDTPKKNQIQTPSRRSNRNNDLLSTPKRTSSRISESDSGEEFVLKTPKRIRGTPRAVKTPISKKIKASELTPSIHARHNPVTLKEGGLQHARESLHVSAVPLSLPCREEEFNNIFTFIEGKISDNSGGCMYISGVPGTGKTATMTEVVRCLRKQVKLNELPKFEYIEINGMRLTEPRQAYVHIYRQLTGKTVAWEQACNLLEARFTKPAPRRCTTVMLVDELDVLCNRRQDVLYNLLDWPAHSAAHLVVVAIANTMDLPERLLMGRVASRLGLTRLTFQPYTYTQLQSIVTARLADTGAFNSDAVQLVARKVAAVSGDARRALDICRRAVELAEVSRGEQVGLSHVNQALNEMIASPKVQAIKASSKMEQFFLQAIAAEVQRTGIEETTFYMVYKQLETICAFGGLKSPSVTESFGICCRLGSCRLIITEHSRNDINQKVLLNVSSDDVHYATQSLSVI